MSFPAKHPDPSMPCIMDHNAECLICDCWPTQCAWIRLLEGNFKYETLDELLTMFKDHLRPGQEAELRLKHQG